MEKLSLRSVNYTQLSAIQHEVAVAEELGFRSPEFLVIRYTGIYRDGAEGKGDALYIVAAAAAAHKAWWAPSTILDCRELEYRWGDEMQWITSIGWNPNACPRRQLAIVVSDKCREALQSLLRDEYADYCVGTMYEAFVMCRHKEAENEQCIENLNQ